MKVFRGRQLAFREIIYSCTKQYHSSPMWRTPLRVRIHREACNAFSRANLIVHETPLRRREARATSVLSRKFLPLDKGRSFSQGNVMTSRICHENLALKSFAFVTSARGEKPQGFLISAYSLIILIRRSSPSSISRSLRTRALVFF